MSEKKRACPGGQWNLSPGPVASQTPRIQHRIPLLILNQLLSHPEGAGGGTLHPAPGLESSVVVPDGTLPPSLSCVQ